MDNWTKLSNTTFTKSNRVDIGNTLIYLIKTLFQKFGYIIKLVTFIYIPEIVMYLGFINTKISK